MNKKQQQVIDNFLSTLDTTLPIVDHFRNALRDALLYKWNSEIKVAIMTGIEDAYEVKK
jgi:hypothetical protein